MGVNKRNFSLKIGGFSEMRIGEDPDLSMTIWENGYQTAFLMTLAFITNAEQI